MSHCARLTGVPILYRYVSLYTHVMKKHVHPLGFKLLITVDGCVVISIITRAHAHRIHVVYLVSVTIRLLSV